MESLTDLEACALGELLQHGPCTAHALRIRFKNSPSFHFSNSAGSIYPMAKRLEKRGQIQSSRKQEGDRVVTYYQISPAGKKALKDWIGPPVTDRATLTIDPLRTRMLFLDQLSESQQKKWLDDSEAILTAKLEEIIKLQQSRSHRGKLMQIQWLADENAIMELRSRLKWLGKARKVLFDK